MIKEKFNDLPGQITCIDTGLYRPRMTACYVIEHNGYAGIVETGTKYSVTTILDVLKHKNLPVENILYVMPTHVHLDHAGGTSHLMQVLPNARVVIHPRGARHIIDPSKLWAGAIAVYGETELVSNYGELLPIDESRVIIAEDRFELDLNGRKLVFIDTPGHAYHHYSVYDEQSQGFFTGDTFGLGYTELETVNGRYIMPTTTPIHFDHAAWHESLDRYMDSHPRRMFLTHYGMVEGINRLADDLRNRIDLYVETAERLGKASNRQAELKSRLMEITLSELADLSCSLPASVCRDLLDMDMELNAQGLLIWLDKI